MSRINNSIGEILRQRRISIPLTLYELSSSSGVSQSHIGRIERGERFPSARVLKKIAIPLGFQEVDLFILAGLLTESTNEDKGSIRSKYNLTIDPIVADTLARESVEVQRAVIGILSLLKMISKHTEKFEQ